MSRVLHIIAFALVGLLSACSAYLTTETEALVRCDYEGDALTILEVQRGIHARPARIDVAVSALTDVLKGALCFPPEFGSLSLDLEEVEYEDWPKEIRADFEEFIANVRIAECRLFRDERQQLCLLRRTRIEHLNRTLEIVNAFVNRRLLENKADHDRDAQDFRPEFPMYDEWTRNAVWSAAGTGHAWITVRGGALVLDYPMSEACASRCSSALVQDGLDEQTAQFIAQASSLRIADARVLLRFCESNKPVMRFGPKPQDVPLEPAVDERLMNALRTAGHAIESALTLSRMRADFESLPTSTPKPR